MPLSPFYILSPILVLSMNEPVKNESLVDRITDNSVINHFLFYFRLIKGLCNNRRLQMFSSFAFIAWSVVFGVPDLSLMMGYTAFAYFPWPFRSLLYLVVGLWWPIQTMRKDESVSRDALGAQGLLWIYTSFHFIHVNTLTGFSTYLLLGLFVLNARSKTPFHSQVKNIEESNGIRLDTDN